MSRPIRRAPTYAVAATFLGMGEQAGFRHINGQSPLNFMLTTLAL